MATPICAGIVALIKESNPNLTPDQIKTLLKSGADLWANDPITYPPDIYGAGYINADNSIPE
jgi:serine protease AprX